MAKTIYNIENLKINKLSQEQYDEAKEWGEIYDNEVYVILPRKITASTTAPTSSDGSNGDIWLVYETSSES